jgi:hypothetical protein
MQSFFFVSLIVVVFALGVYWHFGRSHSLIHLWAERNGYRLLESNYCWFFKGPFFWTSSKGQTVYRVSVQDQRGHRRTGWVRCGSWMLGLLSENVEVRWEE